MSASAPALVASWRVGPYKATLSIPQTTAGQCAAAVIEWEPTLPARLSREEVRAYRRGRDKAVRTLARRLGGSIAVLET